MAVNHKQRPSLSILLALKGLVPLEADCTDRVIVDRFDKVVIERTYQGNSDFVRKIELPANCVKHYEYEDNL